MERELLEKYILEGKTQREIAKIIGVSKSTVGYWTQKYELSQFTQKVKIQYKNEMLFNKIDSREAAYILGYTLADGYVTDSGITYGCAIADREILDYIAYATGGNVKEDLTTNLAQKKHPNVQLGIYNKNIVTDINKHGSKKEDKHIPIIPKEFERYLLLGFFDGDGCLTWGRRKDRNRIWHKISFTASYNLLIGVQRILEKHCQISSSIKPKGKEKCFVLEFASKTSVINFLNFIYPDEHFIVLNRKYNKAQALRLELGEFGEDPRTPSEATEEIAVERVETSGRGNDKTAIAPEHRKM